MREGAGWGFIVFGRGCIARWIANCCRVAVENVIVFLPA
jgi:hypothetical protein